MINSVRNTLVRSSFLLLFLALQSAVVLADCGQLTSQRVERVTIQRVVDGDTFLTKRGKKIRIIGIDTPEIGRKGRRSEPFAIKAKAHLRQLFEQSQQKVRLLKGRESVDRYGRTLAHVFLSDGRNVSQQLLQRGLAVVLIYPPNERFSQCYIQTEYEARLATLGVWSRAEYALKTVKQIKNHHFNRVRGIVTRLKIYNNQTKITLDHRLLIKIKRLDWSSLSSRFQRLQKGDTLSVRGDMHRSKKGYVMRVHHDYALSLD
ncbi:MAG: hypothetical protein HOM11_04270 [Methylococcales bacterium]|nr:hypothetical protein [Methylococcales bacterium]